MSLIIATLSAKWYLGTVTPHKVNGLGTYADVQIDPMHQ